MAINAENGVAAPSVDLAARDSRDIAVTSGSDELQPPLASHRSILDGISEGFALLDAQFRIIDLNKEAMRLDERPREALIGRLHWDAYPDSEFSELGLLYKKAMKERKPVALEHKYEWPDGRLSWLAMRAHPTEDGGLAIFFRDVSERHQHLEQLRKSEIRFRQLAETISEVLYIFEIDDNRMSYVNPAYERVWRQRVDELYADPMAFLRPIHPDDRILVEKAVEQQRTGRASDSRYRLTFADGSITYIHDRAFVATDPDTGARRVVGLAEDVTASTEARQQLARNAETFETLVRNNPFGIYVVDSDFRMLHTSRGAHRVFEAIDPLVGRDFAEILQIIWREPFASEAIGHFRHTLATGEPYTSKAINERRRDRGEEESYDWHIERIVLPGGDYGVVCYFYDLSERVALERQLQRALSDREMAIREIDHRVRNSLSLVSALLSLQGAKSDSVEVKQALAIAGSRLEAVARVHERLYKAETIGVCDFATYLDEICRDLQASLDNGKITISVSTVPTQLNVDQAVPLGLITNELVINAFKHCGPDCSTVWVELSRDGPFLTLAVFDDGAGMPASFQAGARQGLGMRVIATLVGQLNGQLQMPEAGEPARFVVRVPVSDPQTYAVA